MTLRDLPRIPDIVLTPYFINETDSFVMKKQVADGQTIENNIPTDMSPWQKNFFIFSEKEGYTLCPGPNIDYILFFNGLNIIQKNQLDLYTIQWLFSVAMGIYILQSMNIDYQNLTAKSVFIDSNLNARLSNFSYKLNKNDTKVPNIMYYFSPEQCKTIEYQAELSKEEKKKSDVYMFGVFLHEITTRIRHSSQYFNNKSKEDSLRELKKGAIDYMKLKEENKYVPLENLLLKCLNPDPNKRCTINDVIKELLNIDHDGITTSRQNENYFDINNVDMEKYHQYIMDIINFENKFNYTVCKNQIYGMLDNNDELKANARNYTCTFDDLKKGYSKGISYCLSIIDQCANQLNERKEDYEKFKFKYPRLSEFDITKIYFKYRDDSQILESEINSYKYSSDDENNISIDEDRNFDTKIVFKNYYNPKSNTFFTRMEKPAELKDEYITSFLHSVERMEQWEKNFFVIPNRLYLDQSFTFCPGQNIFSFLFAHNPEEKIKKNVLDSYILEWIFSIAMGIYILHNHGFNDLRLNDKLIFIDHQMHARILNISYPLDKNFSTIPYNCYFFSRELFRKTFEDISKGINLVEMDPEESKKSDVFIFGIIVYELLTREKHCEIFKNNKPEEMKDKFDKGLIKHFDLENKRDSIPLCDLLIGCLENEPEKRWGIEKVVNYLVNIDSTQIASQKKSRESNENKYLDLNNIDFERYHKFIIDSVQLDPNLYQNFNEAKINIDQMMNKNKIAQVLKETHNTCSFDDLEYGSKLGIAHCDEIIKTIENNNLQENTKEKYQKFLSENSFSKYFVLKLFLDHNDDDIDKELDKLKGHSSLLFNMDNNQNIFQKYSDYIKLPFNLEINNYPHIVHPKDKFKNRIKCYEHLNLYNFLYDKKNSHFYGQITLQQKMKLLYHVVCAINELHKESYGIDSLTSKNVYIDKDLNADLLVPKMINEDLKSANEDLKDLAERFLESDESCNDISFYYRAPELFNNDIHDVDYAECEVYSVAVLAKELLESNLPWELMKGTSKEEQLHALKNPHWHNFSISNGSSEINKIITILNKCLSINPKEREKIENLYSVFKNFYENTKFTEETRKRTEFSNFKENQIRIQNKIHSDDQKPDIKGHANNYMDQSYFDAQMKDIKGRVDRCKSKVFASNLIIGSVPSSAVRQIALRYIKNTDHNIEISFLVNNTNYGIPNGKALSMKAITNTLDDFKKSRILTKDYGINKKGDAIMYVSGSNT